MARFLFVVPPLTGHVNPTVSVGRALAARGHAVAWVGHPGAVRPLLPPEALLIPLEDGVPGALLASMTAKSRSVRGLAALKFLWEEFLVPLARQMRSGVEGAVDQFRPDVLAVDQQAVAGALVARRRRLPWATLATTSAGVTDALADLPLVKAWLAAQLAVLEQEAGLEPVDSPDQSPQLVLAFTTEVLVGPRGRLPAALRFVGPSISDRAETTPFPFEALREGARVLVSLGTVNAERGDRFYPMVAEALAPLALQVVLIAPPGALDPAPANFLVRPRVPQLLLLPRMSAVVCHAGHNTTCEALAHGLPRVVLPITDAHPVVAPQVGDAGAGVRQRFGRTRPDELRAAVERVLTQPSYREAAGRVRASFERAGGASAAADALEELA